MPLENTLPIYDFHCHSTASDGRLRPAELMERAASEGVELLALTDHDTLGGLDEARQAASRLGVGLINGIEFSVTWQRRELHLVGLGFDDQHASLLALVADQQEARVKRAKAIGRRLDKVAGMTDSYQQAAELAGTDAPGRPLFARVLVAQGKVRDENHAFERFLRQGRSGFVATPWPDIDQVSQVIRAAGGIPVLAHPVRYDFTRRKLRQLLSQLCQSLDRFAIEVCTPGLHPNQHQLLLECLRDFPLAASGGSDFHSPAQHWLNLGKLPALPKGATSVLQWLDNSHRRV